MSLLRKMSPFSITRKKMPFQKHREEEEAKKKILLVCVSIVRYEGPEVDRSIVEKALYKAGEKRFGTDEDTFIRMFSERSRVHLAAVSAAYHNLYGHSLKKAIKKETSGLFEYALLTILKCADNPALYFAKLEEVQVKMQS